MWSGSQFSCHQISDQPKAWQVDIWSHGWLAVQLNLASWLTAYWTKCQPDPPQAETSCGHVCDYFGHIDLRSDVPTHRDISWPSENPHGHHETLFVICNPPMPPHLLFPFSPHPTPVGHLVVKIGTTVGQIDIWSAFGSGWPVYVRVNLVPAAAVILAPWADIKVVAVKKLICYCLQFSIDTLEFWWVCPVCNIPSLDFMCYCLQFSFVIVFSFQEAIFSCQEYVFCCFKVSLFLQYLPKYSLQSSSCFTTQ